MSRVTQAPPAYSERDDLLLDIPRDSQDSDNPFKIDETVAQSDVSIRNAFLRKVYGILFAQIMLTVALGALSMYNLRYQFFIVKNPWIVFVSLFGAIAALLLLSWKPKKYPLNMLLLAIFTGLEGFSLGAVVMFYNSTTVLQALLLTLGIFLALSVFVFQSKYDFSSLGSYLFFGIWAFLIVGLVQIFFPFGSMANLIISIFGALLFCGYIVYDSHMIMNELTPDDYIMASVSLYLDIINLFIQLLRIFGNSEE